MCFSFLTGLLGKEIGVTERFGGSCLVIDDRVVGPVLWTCFPWPEDPEQAERAQLLDNGFKIPNDLNRQKQRIKNSLIKLRRDKMTPLVSFSFTFRDLSIEWRIEGPGGLLEGHRLHCVNPDANTESLMCVKSARCQTLESSKAPFAGCLEFCSCPLLWF